MGIVCCRTKDPFSDHDFFSEPFEDDEKEETAQSVCISRDFRGRMVVNDYVLREIIGKGSFGEVRKAKSRLNSEFVAVKIIDKVMLKKKKVFIKQRMSDMYQCIKREIEILRKLKHRNVIRLVEVINDPKCRKVFIVTEFAEKGSVMTNSTLDEDTARRYFKDLINGLIYCMFMILNRVHSCKIVHRDIKPENLFLMKNGDLKIGDFGLALNYSVQEDQVRQLIGSAAFLAPEMCSSLITEFEIPGIDLWSAGITLWMFLFGFCPFMGSDVPSTYEKILNDPLVFPEGKKKISEEAMDLLTKILTKNPNERISINQVLQHKWFK